MLTEGTFEGDLTDQQQHVKQKVEKLIKSKKGVIEMSCETLEMYQDMFNMDKEEGEQSAEPENNEEKLDEKPVESEPKEIKEQNFEKDIGEDEASEQGFGEKTIDKVIVDHVNDEENESQAQYVETDNVNEDADDHGSGWWGGSGRNGIKQKPGDEQDETEDEEQVLRSMLREYSEDATDVDDEEEDETDSSEEEDEDEDMHEQDQLLEEIEEDNGIVEEQMKSKSQDHEVLNDDQESNHGNDDKVQHKSVDIDELLSETIENDKEEILETDVNKGMNNRSEIGVNGEAGILEQNHELVPEVIGDFEDDLKSDDSQEQVMNEKHERIAYWSRCNQCQGIGVSEAVCYLIYPNNTSRDMDIELQENDNKYSEKQFPEIQNTLSNGETFDHGVLVKELSQDDLSQEKSSPVKVIDEGSQNEQQTTKTDIGEKHKVNVREIEELLNRKRVEYAHKIQEIELQLLKLENRLLMETVHKQNNSASYIKLENLVLKLENELLKINKSFVMIQEENNLLRSKQLTEEQILDIFSKANEDNMAVQQKYLALADNSTALETIVDKQQNKIIELVLMMHNQTDFINKLEEKSKILEDQNKELHTVLLDQSRMMTEMIERMKGMKEEQELLKSTVNQPNPGTAGDPSTISKNLAQDVSKNTLPPNGQDKAKEETANHDSKQGVGVPTVSKEMEELEKLKDLAETSDQNDFNKETEEFLEIEKSKAKIEQQGSNIKEKSANTVTVSGSENSDIKTQDATTDEKKLSEANETSKTDIENNASKSVQIDETSKTKGDNSLDKKTSVQSTEMEKKETVEGSKDILPKNGAILDEKKSEIEEESVKQKINKDQEVNQDEKSKVQPSPGDKAPSDKMDSTKSPVVQDGAKVPKKSGKKKSKTPKVVIPDKPKYEDPNFKAPKGKYSALIIIDEYHLARAVVFPHCNEASNLSRHPFQKLTNLTTKTTITWGGPGMSQLTSFYRLLSTYLFIDCYDHFVAGKKRDMSHKLRISRNHKDMQVFCDMKNGGWTVIMKRSSSSTDFFRDWQEYKNGFGGMFLDFFF